MSARPGAFVTLEGIEGSGKSTLWRRLSGALAEHGHEVVATREPGGTALGAHLRAALLDPAHGDMDPRAELLLYCADRAEHVARVIAPSLARGQIVLCDRFSDATRAYQGFGRGLGLDLVERVNIGDLPPDLTLLLDLPAELGLARARRRNDEAHLDREARFELEELAFHERVRAGYLELARQAPARFTILDASLDPDALASAALDRLLARWPGTRSGAGHAAR